jgi:beta-N-acetylhexosaminidase
MAVRLPPAVAAAFRPASDAVNGCAVQASVPCDHAMVRRRATAVLAVVWATGLAATGCGSSSSPPAPSGSAPASGSPSSTASGSPTSSADPAAACARRIVDGMGMAARAGQLMMVGVPATDPGSGASLVRTYQLGGVFLRGRSTSGVAHTRDGVDTLQSAAKAATGMRLEVAADQEGGLVQTLKGPGFSTIPSALTQSTWSTSRLRSTTTVWANQMVDAGLTLDLAPVADTVATQDVDDNPPIGRYDRQYGSDPSIVAQKVSVVVSAMHSVGLGATVKHFPGLGRVHANTDTSTHAVDDVATANDPNLQPFAAGIAAGATAVMVSSASYPQLDPHHIAVFSSAIVTGLLRQQMGWTGMVMTDDVGNAVAVRSVPVGQRAVSFVAAGGDVVLTVDPDDTAAMTQALVARAASDPTFAALVDAAAYRVVLTKVQAGLAACG